jgi:hypothetical protein
MVKIFLLTSCQLIRRNATSSRDGRVSVASLWQGSKYMLQPPDRYASPFLRSCLYATIIIFARITTAGYHHENYFKGVDEREKYDNFYEKVLKVKDVSIYTFLNLVQRLLVDYIRTPPTCSH